MDRYGRNYVIFCIQATCRWNSDLTVHRHAHNPAEMWFPTSIYIGVLAGLELPCCGRCFADLPSTLEQPYRTSGELPFVHVLYNRYRNMKDLRQNEYDF